MSTISLRIPDSLHRSVRDLAKRESISINQFIATALAEKMSALTTEEYLKARAGKSSRKHFDLVLKKVKDRKPARGDALDHD